MKKFLALFITAVLLAALFAGCGSASTSAAEDIESLPAVQMIELNGSSAKYSGKGVVINKNVITINAEGDYHLTGRLDDGQVVINTGDAAGTVYLYLENADLNCLTAPAIYVLQAEKVHIVLPEGTSNRIVSGTEADLAAHDESANGGAIFAEDDVDFEGEGSLEIYGYINNGVTCKDDLKVEGGNITITAANNGFRGSESVTVEAGSLTINCGNDGIKSTSSNKDGKGFVRIDGGTVNINSGGDGISAETELVITGGSLTVNTSGDSLSESCKAIKANNTITISGGELDLSSDDNAISSNEAVLISGAAVRAVSVSRKGIHADELVRISGGTLDIVSTEDGIQTRGDVDISGGTITVSSGEDCIKAGDKTDSLSTAGNVTVSGGDLRLSGAGDPIEAKQTLTVTGGTIFGAGSPKNPKAPGDGSSQSYLAVSFRGKAGDLLTVFGEGAESSLELSHDCSYVLYTSSGLTAGGSYRISTADSSADAVAK